MSTFQSIDAAFDYIEREIAQVINVDLKEHVTRMLENEIKRAEQEALSKSGIRPLHKFQRTNDGIKVLFDYSREIVADALKEVIRASPVGQQSYSSKRGYRPRNSKRVNYQPGFFREQYVVFVNGEEVETLDQVTWGSRVWIVNVAPYARRLEVGRSSRGSFVIDVEPGFIERTALKKLRPKWGRYVNILFDHIHISDAYKLTTGLQGHYRSIHNTLRKRHMGKDRTPGSVIKYPVITIEPKNVL